MKTTLSRLPGSARFSRYFQLTRLSLLSVACAAPRWSAGGLLAATLLAGLPATVQAQEEGVAKVRDLNKKAVDAYENLEVEEARKFLTQALEVSAAEGLNRHAIKAITHLNLGVVLVGGLKQRDAGIKQFRRALEIDPEARVPKRLNNPDIQAAFEAAGKPDGPTGEPSRGATPPPLAAPPPDTSGAPGLTVDHDALTESTVGEVIEVRAQVQGTARYEKVVLAYRAEGASDFLARDMDREADGGFVASIPEVAVRGASVAYYIEARGRGGQALGRNGSPDAPHVIALIGTDVTSRDPDPADSPTELSSRALRRRSTPQRTWLSLGLGVGGGWAKGVPEVNTNFPVPQEGAARPIQFSNLAPAKLLHVSPEIGYLIRPDIMLSLQGRLQVTSGASEVVFPTCMPDGVCAPATGAVAVLAKATYFLKPRGDFQPYVSFSVGGGYIRYVVDLSEYKLEGCGNKEGTACFDTVAGGGALLGPGVGTWYNLTGPVYLTAALSSLLGVPGTMLNVDLNLGVGYRL